MLPKTYGDLCIPKNTGIYVNDIYVFKECRQVVADLFLSGRPLTAVNVENIKLIKKMVV